MNTVDVKRRSDNGREHAADFTAQQAIDLQVLEDRLDEKEHAVLLVLERNLDALVMHDYEAYRSGFVTDKLADAIRSDEQGNWTLFTID